MGDFKWDDAFNTLPPGVLEGPYTPKCDLLITNFLRNFALLIEKDGGIGPCDVLATCGFTRCYILLSLQTGR